MPRGPSASGPLVPNGRSRMSTRDDEAVLGALIEQLDEELAEAQVVALRLDLDAALGGPVGVEEHEVDVRREVQLDAAELAHAEHEQRQLAAVRAARPAEPRLQARGGKARARRR